MIQRRNVRFYHSTQLTWTHKVEHGTGLLGLGLGLEAKFSGLGLGLEALGLGLGLGL